MTERNERRIKLVKSPKIALEGAGVKISRVFGYNDVNIMDPFLLLDDFGSDNPAEFEKGFPWHPHRGIETITYMLDGKVRHRDSTGGSGVIEPGGIQWMTAGSGIIHEEMPVSDNSTLRGLQLWLNLPATQKMTTPKYRGYKSSDFPQIDEKNGSVIKVIAGKVRGVSGPIQDISTNPEYLDVRLSTSCQFTHVTPSDYTVFAYVLDGQGVFTSKNTEVIGKQSLVLFGDGEQVSVKSLESPLHFILISAKPLREPIAWQGPIVMNTQKELRTAFQEYRKGTFIKA
ncbi:MAG: Pirin [Candidatus Thorarchaeota archaeon]|nr:MAG: Pirin [Candidatus Thorarchaeota archaeon]